MCGIVGCILKKNKNVSPILFNGISKLEYRGYDSVGLATYDNDINVKKAKGNIESVNGKLNFKNMKGNLGIAHIRWATIGNPSDENAHPHLDETRSVAIVHNGTLENYVNLKEELIEKGYCFKSTTDSEVIPNLIKKYMDDGLHLEGAIRKTTVKLKGSYAIVAFSKNEPDKLVATRNESPLIVAQGNEGYFVASETTAVEDYAHNIIRGLA